MDKITVSENGQPITFTFAELLKYHGPGFPGGVAHALKVMQAAFPLLGEEPLERREVVIETAFSGPGGRDCMEMVTRCATDGRLTVDRSLGGRNVIDDHPGPYFWRFTYRGRTVEARIRPGHVREEFVRLGAKPDKTPEETSRHEELKAEMAGRLVPLDANKVYDATRVNAEVSG